MSDQSYRFKNLPLTPAIIEFLICELFPGQLVERQAIVEEVRRTHLARGGKNADAQSITESVKKALSNMKDRGLVENPAVGYWRMQDTNASPSGSDLSESIEELLSDNTTESLSPKTQFQGQPDIDLTLGKGTGAIYLYYLPTYRQLAEARGERAWPCKIGRTDRDPLERILSQAATAPPERPHVSIVLRTTMPVAWESALHGVLTVRGLKIQDSPGTEWFLTSPDDVLGLVRLIDASIFEDRATKPTNADDNVPSNDLPPS